MKEKKSKGVLSKDGEPRWVACSLALGKKEEVKKEQRKKKRKEQILCDKPKSWITAVKSGFLRRHGVGLRGQG